MSKFWDWMEKREGKFETSEVPLDLLLNELRERYAPSVIPPCRICGGKLSCERVGGGSPTVYACSGHVEDSMAYQSGRSCADKHYRDSEFIDYRHGGDSLVIELIDRFLKKD